MDSPKNNIFTIDRNIHSLDDMKTFTIRARIAFFITIFLFFSQSASWAQTMPTFTATWLDDGDGDIDQLRLDFSIPVSFSDANGPTGVFDAITITGGIALTNPSNVDYGTITGVRSFTFDVAGVTGTSSPSVNISYVQGLQNGITADAGGQQLSGGPSSVIDEAVPVLISSSPLDDALDVAVNTNVVLEFSEDVAVAGQNSVTLVDMTGTRVSSQVSTSGSTVTISPSSNLENLTNYAVNVAGTAIEDLATPVNTISNNTTIDFTTIGVVPTYTATWLDDGDGDIDQLRLDFSIPVSFSDVNGPTGVFDAITITGGIALTNPSSVDYGTIIGVRSFTFDVAGVTGTSSPSVNISYVQGLQNGITADAGGQQLSGGPSSVIDGADPVLISSSPLDDALDVAVNTTVELEFSEGVLVTDSDSVTLVDATGTPIAVTVFNFGGSRVFIDPPSDLENLTNYAVNVAGTAIEDLATPVNTISNNTTIDFTTIGVVPTYTATWLDDGDGDIDQLRLDFSIPVSFSDANGPTGVFDAITITSGIALTNPSSVDYGTIIGVRSFTFDVAGVTGTSSPADSISYAKGLQNGITADAGGQQLSGSPSSVIDEAVPVIAGFALLAGNVAVDVTFSEPIYNSDGSSPVDFSDFTDAAFSDNGNGGATGVAITGATANTNLGLTGGETVIRVLTLVSGISEADDSFEIRPSGGAALYDASGNPMSATQSTGTIMLNVVHPADIPGFVSVLPDAGNDYFILEFTVAVDRDPSLLMDSPLRYANDKEIFSTGYNDPDGNTLFSIPNGDLNVADNNILNTGTTWRLNINVGGSVAPGGNESVDIYARNNNEVYNSATGDAMPGTSANAFTVFLADEHSNDFGSATAVAYDVGGDGNIDEVEIVMPDGIKDATIDETAFTFNGVPGDVASFDTGTASDDNTFRITFSGYTGTAVGTLDYTTGTLEDDAEFTTYNGTSGNLFLSGSVTPVDAAGPVVISALTGDTDRNGKIDEIDVIFSEPITEVGTAMASDFTIGGGYRTSGVVAVGASNVAIDLIESGVFDTHATPTVDIGPNIVEDAVGAMNPARSFGAADDGAAPFVTVAPIASTSDPTPDLMGEVDDPSAVVLVTVGVVPDVVLATNNMDGTWTLPGDSITTLNPGGPYQVVMTAFDAFANVGSDAQTDDILLVTGGVVIAPVSESVSMCIGDERTLSDITLTETNTTDFASEGTFILSLPAGFEFNTGATISITDNAGDVDVDVGSVEYIGTSVISVFLDNDRTDNDPDIVTISGLVVKAVGIMARTNESITIGGTAGYSTGQSVMGDLNSLARPAALTSVNETVNAAPNITELSIRLGLDFTLDATNQASTMLNWYEDVDDGTPEFVGTIATEADLNVAEGLHTYFLRNENASLCESVPLTFNLLVFDDDDPLTGSIDATFVDNIYIVTEEPDTLYLSNAAGNTVTVMGAGTTITNPSDPNLLVLFDPAIAGEGDHNVVYTVTNDITGESVALTITLTVNPETEFFLEMPDIHCNDEFPFTVTLDPINYGPNTATDLQFVDFLVYEQYYINEVNSGALPFYNVPAGDIGTTFPWNMPFELDLARIGETSGGTTSMADGGGVVLSIIKRSRDPVLDVEISEQANVFVYGSPLVSLPGISMQYCESDGAFNIQRDVTYANSFTSDNPDSPEALETRWSRNITVEPTADIANGYLLLYDAVDSTFTNPDSLNFTASVIGTIAPRGIEIDFDPNDPDHDTNVAEDESGFYRIVYTTEDLTPANCTGTAFVDVQLLSAPTAPTLDAATMAFGNTLNFVNTNEYLLEYCTGLLVGDDITGEKFVAAEGMINAANPPDNINYYNDAGLTDLLVSSNSGMPLSEVLSVSGSNKLTIEETVVFYMTQTVNGCESPSTKVALEVYDRPARPVFDFSAFDPAVEVGSTYLLDYCVPFGGGRADPDDIVLASLLPGEAYNVDRSFFDASVQDTTLAQIVIDVDGPVSIDVPVLEAGDIYKYTIAKTENINENAGTSTFTGCTGNEIVIINYGREEPDVVSAVDFADGTLQYHITEGDILGNIAHSAATGINEYTWYENADHTNQIGEILTPGESRTQAELKAEGFDNTAVAVPGTNDPYTYYVSRTNNVVSSRNFPGCESNPPATEITITVHARQPAPTIMSDNSASTFRLENFQDLNSDGNPATNDPAVDFNFAICVDQIESVLQFDATELAYLGPPNNGTESERRFEWYDYDILGGVRTAPNTPLFVGTDADFIDLELSSIVRATIRYLDVVQVTDIDEYAGVEGASTLVKMEFFDQQVLTFSQISDGDDFCADDASDRTLDLLADGFSAGNGNVSYFVTSMPAGNTIGSVVSPMAGNPTIDFDTWHTNATGSAIGGMPTVHTITMLFTDPLTKCVGRTSATVAIHPDPDITFAINGADDNNVSFCYDEPEVMLEGFFVDLSLLNTIGTGFSYKGDGILDHGDGTALFDPAIAHGSNPFANQSSHIIDFTYTDEFGCDDTVQKTLLVDPRPEAVRVGAGDEEIQFSSVCYLSTLTAFVDIVGAPAGYAGYTFDWILPPDATSIVPFQNQIAFESHTVNFRVEVTITDPNGCSVIIDEPHSQNSAPRLSFTRLVDVAFDFAALDFSSPGIRDFCWDGGMLTLELNTNEKKIGVAPNTDINDLSYTIDSYLESDPVTPFDSDAGSGNPVIDFASWHENGASGGGTGGMEIGGESTVHVITMTYQDRTDNQYQGKFTNCIGTVSTAIRIRPRPDIDVAYDMDGDLISTDDPEGLQVCYDDASIDLRGFFADLSDLNTSSGFFSGNGVSGTSNNQTTFDPSLAHDSFHGTEIGEAKFLAQSTSVITFEYTEDGCYNSVTKTIVVNPLPEVEGPPGNQIVYDAICVGLPIEAHVVIYEAGTTDEVASYAGYTFDWATTEASVTVLNDPSVTLPAAANLSVGMTLTVTSPDGCTTVIQDIDVQGFPPVPSFTYVGITARSAAGLDVSFQKNSELLPDGDVNFLEFTMTGPAPSTETVVSEIRNSNDLSSLNVTGLIAGEYSATVRMGTVLGCNVADVTRMITILPVETLGDPISGGGYRENFETDMGGWFFEYASEDGKNDTTRNFSWKRMRLNSFSATNDDILSDGRGNIIVTQAPEAIDPETLLSTPTPYYEGEISYVYSPALDFSQYTNPALKFDYIRDFESNRDGLAVQISGDDGRTWQTLGDHDIDSGINWYSNQGISAGPGDNQGRFPETGTNPNLVGFADVPIDEDDNRVPEWLEARHQITKGLYEKNLIRFRFSLSALTGSKIDALGDVFDGFAFDNFELYEINKLLVVEQFSSTLSADSKRNEEFLQTGQVDGAGPTHHLIDWDEGTQGVWINYYTDVFNDDVNEDPINVRNKIDPSTRSTYFGVTDVPDNRISGIDVPYDLDVTPEDFGNGFNALALFDADFNINKNHPTLPDDIVLNASADDVVSVTTTFMSLTTEPEDVEIGFFFAIVEKVKTGVTSGVYGPLDIIRYPLRALLPGPAGEYYRGTLTNGQLFVHTMEWPITGVDDPDNLRIIAYVQYYSHPNPNKVGSIEQAAWIDLAGERKVNLVTGSGDLNGHDVLEIYPNPADNSINLTLPEAPGQDVFWTIYDQSERQVLKGLIKRGTKIPDPIDSSNLPSGMYIIQLHSEKRKWTPEKVLISH